MLSCAHPEQKVNANMNRSEAASADAKGQLPAELCRVYLDGLLGERARWQARLHEADAYHSARTTAVHLFEHLSCQPEWQALLPELPAEGGSLALAVGLDFLRRELSVRVMAQPEREDFRHLEQQLTQLLPKLWHDPETQAAQIRQHLQRMLRLAQAFDNQELAQALTELSHDLPSVRQVLTAIDTSLQQVGPARSGLLISEQVTLLETLLNQDVGLHWQRVADPLRLPPGFELEPCLILIAQEQPVQAIESLRQRFPKALLVLLLDLQAPLQSEAVSDQFEAILDQRMLASRLPALAQRAILRDWQTHRASQDGLTNLPTVVGGRQVFEQLQALAGRFEMPLVLAVLRLPDWEQYERAEGPYLASEWLRTCARSLRHDLRSVDVLLRWAPDQFVVLMPQTPLPGAIKALERCHQELVQSARQISPVLTEQPCLFQAGLVSLGAETDYELALQQAWQQLPASAAPAEQFIYFDASTLPEPSLRHVLLLDDDPIIQQLLHFTFAHEGYQITQLFQGNEQILEVLSQEPISLIVLDVKMPGMDGFEVLKMIRSRHQYDAIPIVMLTSMKQEADLARAFELGADDYVYKPFSPMELLIRTQRFLKAKP